MQYLSLYFYTIIILVEFGWVIYVVKYIGFDMTKYNPPTKMVTPTFKQQKDHLFLNKAFTHLCVPQTTSNQPFLA